MDSLNWNNDPDWNDPGIGLKYRYEDAPKDDEDAEPAHVAPPGVAGRTRLGPQRGEEEA